MSESRFYAQVQGMEMVSRQLRLKLMSAERELLAALGDKAGVVEVMLIIPGANSRRSTGMVRAAAGGVTLDDLQCVLAAALDTPQLADSRRVLCAAPQYRLDDDSCATPPLGILGKILECTVVSADLPAPLFSRLQTIAEASAGRIAGYRFEVDEC